MSHQIETVTGCRWIEGHPLNPGWSFCDNTQKPGSSYCPEHHDRCFIKVDKSKPKKEPNYAI